MTTNQAEIRVSGEYCYREEKQEAELPGKHYFRGGQLRAGLPSSSCFRELRGGAAESRVADWLLILRAERRSSRKQGCHLVLAFNISEECC